jgi:hypothetical protein
LAVIFRRGRERATVGGGEGDMSEVLGRKIKAASLSPSQIAKIYKDNSHKKERSPIGAMFEWYDAHDLVGNPLILRAILGREPRALRAYFEELAAGTQLHFEK